MKQQVWSSPKTAFEEFVPQVYCKNCSADDNTKYVYNFTCDAGASGLFVTNTVYLETNGISGLQISGDSKDTRQSTSYGPCGATHTVEVMGKLTEESLNQIFPKGWVYKNGYSDHSDEAEEVRVWTANGTNTHCTTALDIDDFQLAKS